jgi:hypothetical protein
MQRGLIVLFLLINCSLGQTKELLLGSPTNTNPNDTLQSQKVLATSLKSVNGVSELKFNEFYKMPIGPKGLELTPKLLSLLGKKIRIVGYMAKTEPAIPSMFILSPVPVEMGDEDEKLVDDLPPNALFVHMNDKQLMLPHIEGLINITGVLRAGSFTEPDGHISTFQLVLDPEIVKDFKRALATAHASSK